MFPWPIIPPEQEGQFRDGMTAGSIASLVLVALAFLVLYLVGALQ